MLFSLIVSSLIWIGSTAVEPKVCIVIRSQPNSYFIMKAEALKNDIIMQAGKEGVDIEVIMTHEEYATGFHAAWSILPMMSKISRSHAKNHDWIMFVEDGTVVNVKKLMKTLSRFDPSQDMFLARGLFDADISILHHFARRKSKSGGPFLFPDFQAGWALSSVLVKKAEKKLEDYEPELDFQIDIKHEAALYFSKELGVEITKVPEFCGAGEENPGCATNVIKHLPICDDRVTLDNILVGVKTTLKFHKDRVKVVMDTWGKKVKHIKLYSNVTDQTIPTFDCGIENTVSGHCGKTNAILKDFNELSKSADFKWLVIADDDSIISIARLVQFLNCFDPDEAVFMGEKYGYGLTTSYGYPYITGGGGMIFSKPAVETWVTKCHCPSIDSPDDMILGSRFDHYGVEVIHSPLFHQARPDDYAEGYLSNQTPISFHKHWMIDPRKVYKTWFEEADSKLPTYEHGQVQVLTTATPSVVATPLPPTPLEHPNKDEL